MNKFLIINGMKIKTIYVILAAFLLVGGATTILSQGTNHVQQVDNPLIAAANSNQGDSFREQRLTEAQGVENIVNNVLDGDVQPLDGYHSLEQTEILANHDIDISPVDMQVNKNYVAFVVAAENVCMEKLYTKTGDVKGKYAIMEDKKAQI
jgi:hypothetical protein